MRRFLLLLTLLLSIPLPGVSEPRAGAAMPTFTVDDLEGTHHTQRDLLGGYTVICAMTDKDIGDALEAWWRPIEAGIPAGTTLLSFTALDIFALVPTDTVLSQARARTPRPHWSRVWLSRDGALAQQLGLPDSELPWVFVVDPRGRVLVSIHAAFDRAGLARVIEAIPRNESRSDRGLDPTR